MLTTAVSAALLAAALLLVACGGGSSKPKGTPPSDVIALGARQGTAYGLYLVRSDGTGLQKLTGETGEVTFLRWSPTGDRIAYLVGGASPADPSTLRIYDFVAIETTTVSDHAQSDPDGPAMTWSRDGTRLAFAEAGVDNAIRVYDADRGKLTRPADLFGRAPDWSPAADELAVVAPSGQETDLVLASLADDSQRPLLERPGNEGSPRWSPDGRLLAFWSASAAQPADRQLLVLEANTGRLTELGLGSGPAWTPDNLSLAYSRPPEDPARGDLDIFLTSVSTGQSRPLADSLTLDRWPSWSPAGDRVVYQSLVDQSTALVCLVQLAPETHDCLDLQDLVPGPPAWSPR